MQRFLNVCIKMWFFLKKMLILLIYLHFSVDLFIYLFLHNLGVLNSGLSDNILCLVGLSFTYK